MKGNGIKYKLLLLGIFLFGVGFGLAYNKADIFKKKETPIFSPQYLPANGTSLVRPLLRVETPQSSDPRLRSVKYSIERYIKTAIKNKEASDISVYIMDLNEGAWVGINQDSTFALASLIKVPIMMIYLKRAEKDPAILDKDIKYEIKSDALPPNILGMEGAELGNTYTVDQLLYYMITSSDNVSMMLLMANMDARLINRVGTDLHLLSMIVTGRDRLISTYDVARLFQALYYATYLNKDMSSKALELLSQSKYCDGLVAGVPKDVTVAHKFAERAYSPGNEKQLHDCGIVYYEKRPYLICVMTKGWDLKTLQGIIKHVSILAYDHMAQPLDVY